MEPAYQDAIRDAAATLEKQPTIQIFVARCADVPEMVVMAQNGDDRAARRLALIDTCMTMAKQHNPVGRCLICAGGLASDAAGALIVLSENFEAPESKALFYFVCEPCAAARTDDVVFRADIRRRLGGTLIQHEAGHA